MANTWYEDFAVGDSIRTAGLTLTEAQIIDWALTYDPQPFHMDREVAADSVYGGLIASGWQVGTLSFRLLHATGFLGPGSQGSPGLENVKWHRPVRPGDTIRTEVTVLSRRESRSRPDLGLIDLGYRVLNQDDEVAMSYTAIQLVRRRPAEG